MTAVSAPVELYLGHTVHERSAPFTHRFRYRIASILIDLERLDEAGRLSALFSVEGFNLYGFRSRDHGARDGSSLAQWARTRFEEAGIAIGQARLRLLCFPRVLGYVFNPLSVYVAEGPDGALKGVIYQVHNTFGDRHAYVAPCSGATPERQEAGKALHVSPFFDMGGRYEFTLRAPGERFQLTILKQREAGPDLLATMALRRKPLTGAALVGLFASQPFSSLKTIGAIHLEALKLWMKGARYHRRPAPPETDSHARLSEPPAPASLGRKP
ncbi:MAG: DUF1365 domain-containing protein [Oceanicaulis sp.]|nr:DUF1365 domain-containing protein [Oceanicaulis sp.]